MSQNQVAKIHFGLTMIHNDFKIFVSINQNKHTFLNCENISISSKSS